MRNTSPEEAKQILAAKQAELKKIHQYEAVEAVHPNTIPKGDKAIPMMWVVTKKRVIGPDGVPFRKYKARLVVRS